MIIIDNNYINQVRTKIFCEEIDHCEGNIILVREIDYQEGIFYVNNNPI